jgi:hypothetical protein
VSGRNSKEYSACFFIDLLQYRRAKQEIGLRKPP